MKIKSLIIVLILIIILFGGYIGYDLLVVHKNAENEKSNNNEYGKKAIVVSAYDGIEYMTVTDKDYIDGDEARQISMKASIPKLNLNTNNAVNFNKKIYDAYKLSIDDIENGYSVREGEGKYLGFEIEYEYDVAGDIVYILIKEEGGALNHSGFSTYKGFYYDMKNDKEISLDELYKKYDITVEKIEKEYERKGPSFNEYYPEPNGLYYIMPGFYSLDLETYTAYISGIYYYDEVQIQR